MDQSERPLLDGKDERRQRDIETQSPAGAYLSRQDRFTRRTLPAILLVLGLWLVFRSNFIASHHYCPGKGLRRGSKDDSITLVPFEAHLMSKCPDAKACLEQLVVPAMVEISEKVNFTLSYIGSVDPDSDEVSCMHGPAECLGNIIELCAAKVYPDPVIYLGFTNCMTSEYQNIPHRELVEGCAMEHSVDFQKLNACISDEGEGIDLLRASVIRSQDANVTKSCTIRLNNKIRCIRDGGEWYDCPGGSNVTTLTKEIDDLYRKLN